MGITKNTVYSADFINQLIQEMFITNQAVQKGAVYVIEKPNSSDKFVVPRMRVSDDNLQPYSPTPRNSKGDITYDEVEFDLVKAMLYSEFGINVLENIWQELRIQGQMNVKQLSPEVQGKVIELFNKAVNQQVGKLIWQGDTDSADTKLNIFNGLLKVIDADADVIDVSNIGVITTTNVLQVLQDVWSAIPDEILEAEGITINMSTKDWKAYKLALKSLDFKGGEWDGSAEIDSFMNIPIKHYSGMQDNRIVCCVSTNGMGSNLMMGTETLSDIDTIMIDRTDKRDDIFFILSKFKADCKIGFGSELVNYLGS